MSELLMLCKMYNLHFLPFVIVSLYLLFKIALFLHRIDKGAALADQTLNNCIATLGDHGEELKDHEVRITKVEGKIDFITDKYESDKNA